MCDMTQPWCHLRRATVWFGTLSVGCFGHGAGTPAPGAGSSTPTAAPPAAQTSTGQPAPAPNTVRFDPLAGGSGGKVAGLQALEDELHRAMAELGKQNPPPYYIGYEVHDRRVLNLTAAEGALTSSADYRTRVLSTDVRVGDHRRDSSHALRGTYGFDGADGLAMLPLEDAALPIRAVAWAETDRRYKAAVERLRKITSDSKLKTAEEDPSDDFSAESPMVFVEPPASVTVDVAAWETRVRRLSARFQRLPEPHQSYVTLEINSVNRWIATSEGASVQTGRNYARLSIMASVRTEDGMRLERHESFDAAELAGLPDEPAMEQAIATLIADLEALRRAPLAEPYVGPAILEGKAAAVFFHEIFGHRIEGHRQKRDDEGQTFAKKIGEPVMPAFISVYDDPALARIGDSDLNGFYRFDDEGVAAQRVSLVESGVLKGFLMGRSPVRDFTRSNGHGRRQEGRTVVARQGNLVVQPARAVSHQELRQRLRAEAQRQGKPFGLLFSDISGGFTNTGRMAPQAFKVLPILVYRVWVDGRPDELLRGADLVGTPLASLSKILAAGADYRTFNGLCGAESGYLPVSATSPSLLVQQIEIERRQKGNEKPPLLAAPARTAPVADEDAVRRAMHDELARTRTSLHLDDQPRPYFAAYTVTDTELVSAHAMLGALTNQSHSRWRNLGTTVRIGDRSFDNSSYGPLGSRGSLPLDDDYAATRRTLWLHTDEAYKHAVEDLARKQATVAAQAAADDDKLPDFWEQPPAQTVFLPTLPALDPPALSALLARLSSVFADYPSIATSQVTAIAGIGRQRHLNTDGTWADERDGGVFVEVDAATQAADGMRVRDQRSFAARSSAELQGRVADLAQEVHGLADELVASAQATIPENGDAVVLFEGRAATQLIRHLLADRLAGTPQSKLGNIYSPAPDDLTDKLGQRVTAAFLSAYDDPRQEIGPGRQVLVGSYHADDEGVPAQKVSLIENGILKTLLTSRTPIKGLTGSNGHARSGFGGGVRGHIGNLFITARGGLARPALHARLGNESRRRHCTAYIVRLIDEGGSDLRGSGSLEPLVAFQLKDGKEVPVRGFSLEGLLPKTLKDLVAAGREPYVMNFIDGYRGIGITSSIIAPALLFADLEVRKKTDRNPKLPLYPHPLSVMGKPSAKTP
jgi:predicted Zn-dependent protease